MWLKGDKDRVKYRKSNTFPTLFKGETQYLLIKQSVQEMLLCSISGSFRHAVVRGQ